MPTGSDVRIGSMRRTNCAAPHAPLSVVQEVQPLVPNHSDRTPGDHLATRSLGLVMLAAGALSGIGVALETGDRVARVPMGALAIAAASVGATLMLSRNAVPGWLRHLVVIAWSLALLGGATLSGGDVFAMAILYVWIGAFVGYFTSTTATMLHLSHALVFSALTVSTLDDVGLPEWWMLATTTVVAAVLGGRLARVTTMLDRDALTGTLSRHGLTRELDHVLRAGPRTAAGRAHLAILCIDNPGATGTPDRRLPDDAVRAVARAVRDELPPAAVLGRIGDGELAVVVRTPDTAMAAELVECLRALAPEPARCSAGLAAAEEADVAATLMARAEVALQQSRTSPVGQLTVVEDDADAIAAVRHAVAQDQLILHYQPIVDLGSGRTVGVEALVRWNHPEHGLVQPDRFVPLAERSGAILPLGQWVLETACAQMGRWIAERPAGDRLTVSVNLSVTQLDDLDLVPMVQRVLRDSGLRPHNLCLEVTETATVTHVDAASATLRALQADGIRLAIDDFGSGQSSLRRLSAMPFQIMKLDRSLVVGSDDEAGDLSMLRAVIQMADALGLRTVAEGVEEPEQLARLREAGCRLAQGYLLSRPLPASDVPALLDQPPDDLVTIGTPA